MAKEKKLMFVALNTKNTEFAYVDADIHARLIGSGFLRYDGFWIQRLDLWFLFFEGLRYNGN